MTYDAIVTVPAPLTALMSARLDTSCPSPAPSRFAAALGDTPIATFAFSQPVPIPSYLLALVVGHLSPRTLGPSSRVWAEPEVVDAAADEFGGVSDFLVAGIALAGEYRWGQYDLLMLPASFPYGGMENPCLTFVTPTLLTGDRSATNVVAHEIAHSWTGNLVTNSTWEHFWLNEGWTVRQLHICNCCIVGLAF
jgi:leukotriene-A4 hydrolase